MKHRWRRILLLVAITAAGAPVLTGCGGEAVITLLVITNTWMEVGDDAHTFGFTADPGVVEPAGHGTFTGTETLPHGAGEFDFTGSWANAQITINVERTPHPVVYTGTFTNDPDTIMISDGTRSLLIYRDRNP